MTSHGSPSPPPTRTFGEVIGLNVRSLRDGRGLTQHEFLSRCRALGLQWPRSRLVLLEAGRVRDVSLSELTVFASALDMDLGEALKGADVISLPEGGVTCRTIDVQNFLAGGPPVVMSLPPATPGMAEAEAAAALMGVQPFEKELALRFDVPEREIQYSANIVFGRSLVAERDARVAAKSGDFSKEERTAHRGHVARELRKLIRADLQRRNKVY